MGIFLRFRFAAFCFFLTTCVSVAQAPVNDECAGALVIQAQDDIASTVSVPANFSEATLSAGAVSCGTPSQGASDLWFRFTAHHSKYILDSYDGAYAEVFQGDCDNLQLVYCKNGVSYLDNLVPETEYFLRLIVPWPDLSLNFRLVKAPDASANDLCSNALPLTSTGQPQNLVGANLEGVPLPSGNITTSVLGDLWYSFVAEENYASVAISVSIFDDYDFTGQLFTGDCDALTLVSNLGDFHIGSWSRVTPQLTPGQTYYVRIFSFGVSTNWNYSIRVNHLASPANDLCENANVISLDDDGVTAVSVPSVTYATPSEGVTSTCSSNSVKDLWYRFSAPEATLLITANSVVTVYSGGCDALEQVQCGTSFALADLTAGQEYFIRATNSQTITLTELNAADECPDATELTPGLNPPFVTSSTIGMTQSGPAMNCGIASRDVWFRFTATSAKHQIVSTNASDSDQNSALIYSFYSGNCDALELISCQIIGTNSVQPILTGLTIGQEYFIRATRSIDQTFGIKVIHINVQPNDEIANASEIIPGTDTCQGITGSTDGSTASTGLSGLCGSSMSFQDVWYWFTANSERYSISGASASHDVSVYKQDESGTLQLESCNDGRMHGFEPGSVYFIRVSAYMPANHAFSICIYEILDFPVNDLCQDAIAVPVASDLACDPVTADISKATFGLNATTFYPCTDTLKNVWYSFEATDTSVVIRNSAASVAGSTSFRFSLYADCDSSCLSSGNLSPGDEMVLSGLTEGATYFLSIYSSEYNTMQFCLGTTPDVPNDSCSTPMPIVPAADLSCNDLITVYSQLGTVDTTMTFSGCGSGFPTYLTWNSNQSGYADLWYEFTATAGEHLLDFYSGNVVAVQLFSGGCGSLTCAGSVEYISPNWNGHRYAIFSGLSVGENYRIRIVSEKSNQLNTMTFCLKTPVEGALNDEYASAPELLPTDDLDSCNPVSGMLNHATFSSVVPEPSCNLTGDPDDVWYTFTATAVDHQLQVTATNPDATGITWMSSLYSSSGGTIVQEVFCFDMFDALLDVSPTGTNIASGNFNVVGLQNYVGLTPGQTYYIRLYPFNGIPYNYDISEEMTFEVCVKTLPPLPGNRTIETAETIAASAGTDLQYISGYATRAAYKVDVPFNTVTNLCAELNALGIPQNQASNVWYSFTASQNGHRVHVVNDADVLPALVSYLGFDKYPIFLALYEYVGSDLKIKQCSQQLSSDSMDFLNLEPGKEYFIKLMYRQIHYVTDFEFQIALSSPLELSLTDASMRKMALWPNPVSDVLNISTGSAQSISSVEIMSVDGRSLGKRKVENNQVDVSALPSGVYLLKAETDDTEMIAKFIRR